MLKRNYVISGFSIEMVAKWMMEFRDDLKLFVDKKTGEVQAKIPLSIFEAIKMKQAIKKYNLTHPCVLKLTKINGERFRV